MSRFTFLLVLGAVVGAVTGLVTVIFRMAALTGEALFFPVHGHHPVGLDLFSTAAMQRLLMPAFGGLICGFFLFKIGKYTGSHSIPAILQAVASGQSYFKSKMLAPPSLAIVTLATGGSVGPEGPIAEIGSVTGSLIGRWTKMPPKLVKTLIGAGVAAGIAAVFNAPIGGVFFAIEVILRNYEMASFTPIAVAAVVASVIAQASLGDHMAIQLPSDMAISLGELPYYVVLGLVCGAISIFYIYGLSWCHERFRTVGLALWLKPMLGGLMVGLIGLFLPRIMGEGYDWINEVIRGEVEGSRLLWLLLLLVVFKVLATGLTLGSGNPGGSFAPAVFIGVMGGAAYGILLERLGLVESGTPYAVMGMAGLIAGALGAPVTAIMITLGFGGRTSIELLLALMTTVALSLFVMQTRRNVSVYTLEFLRLGIDLDRAREADPLSLIDVRSVMHTSDFEELPAAMAVYDAFERFKDSSYRWFVVQGDEDEFVGIVSLHEMRVAIAEEELAHLLVLADITDGYMPRLHPEMSIKAALKSFNATDAEVLPVFRSGKANAPFVGVISRQDALDAYWRLTQSEEE